MVLVSLFLIITYHQIPEKKKNVINNQHLKIVFQYLQIIELNLQQVQYFGIIFFVHLNLIFELSILMLHVNLHILHQLNLDGIKLLELGNELGQSN